MRKYIVLLSVVVCLIAGAVGCSGDTAPENIPPPTTTTTIAAVTTTQGQSSPIITQLPPAVPPQSSGMANPTTGVEPESNDCDQVLAGWKMEPEELAGGTVDAQLTAVDVGQHPCFDRVVFRIAAPPEPDVWVRVEYLDGPLIEDPTGFELEVAGEAVLQVIFYARAEDLLMAAKAGMYPVSYPAEMFTQWGALREVKFAGTFENVTSYGLGTIANAFRIDTGYKDGRYLIIVDIAH